MMEQYGFFFDQSRCTGCHACAVACKNWNQLPPGPLKYLRIYQYEKGAFPDIRVHFQWIPCYHCEEPACVHQCPNQALYKEEKYGSVQMSSEVCDGCRLCYEACPYGALVFEGDEVGSKAQKCNMCIDRLEMGLQPVCASSCPLRALDFGPLKVLQEKYGNRKDLEDLPSSQATKPAIIFKPHAPKRQLVPYDVQKALRVLMRRDPLPPVFSSPGDVTEISKGIVGRGELVVKSKSSADLLRATRNDDG